jgi:hypothetical protein
MVVDLVKAAQKSLGKENDADPKNIKRKGKSAQFRRFNVIIEIEGGKYALNRFYHQNWFPSLETALNIRSRIDIVVAARLLNHLLERKDLEAKQVLREFTSLPPNTIFKHIYSFPMQSHRVEDWIKILEVLSQAEAQLALESIAPEQQDKTAMAKAQVIHLLRSAWVEYSQLSAQLKGIRSKFLGIKKLSLRGMTPKFSAAQLQYFVVDATWNATNFVSEERSLIGSARRIIDQMTAINDATGGVLANRLAGSRSRTGSRLLLYQVALSSNPTSSPEDLTAAEMAAVLSRQAPPRLDLREICKINMARLALQKAKPPL